MKRLSCTVTLMVVTVLIPALSLAKPKIYSEVPLLGTEEVPPNNSLGFGALTAIYD